MRVVADVALLELDLHRLLATDLVEQLGEGRRQVPDSELAEVQQVLVLRRLQLGRLRHHQVALALAALAASVQLPREVAVALVLKQPTDQVIARVQLLLELDRLVRQQLTRLDLHQRARHHDEVPDVL